jgi:hypothetical protein
VCELALLVNSARPGRQTVDAVAQAEEEVHDDPDQDDQRRTDTLSGVVGVVVQPAKAADAIGLALVKRIPGMVIWYR